MEDNKNSLTKAIIEKENLRSELMKMEAKIRFQDKSDKPSFESCSKRARSRAGGQRRNPEECKQQQ